MCSLYDELSKKKMLRKVDVHKCVVAVLFIERKKQKKMALITCFSNT
ncbi:hypothetical protein DERP_013959, partial [Dermatophagoides pteronyssinus]